MAKGEDRFFTLPSGARIEPHFDSLEKDGPRPAIESLRALLVRVSRTEEILEERHGYLPAKAEVLMDRLVENAHRNFPDGIRHFKKWRFVRLVEDTLGRGLTSREAEELGVTFLK